MKNRALFYWYSNKLPTVQITSMFTRRIVLSSGTLIKIEKTENRVFSFQRTRGHSSYFNPCQDETLIIYVKTSTIWDPSTSVRMSF